MTNVPGRSSIRAWLASRAESYAHVNVALCLNVPLLYIALVRHLEGVDLTSLPGIYASLVIVGYYFLLLQILITAVFAVCAVSTRVAVFVCAAVITAAISYLLADGFVYRVFRFHIDAFWLQYALTSFSGIGLPGWLVGAAAAALAVIIALQAGLFRLARRLPSPRLIAGSMIVTAVVAYAASQALHIVAYERNDARFTHITPRLPFYYPIMSHKDAVKYANALPMIGGSAAPEASVSLAYPSRGVSCPPSPGARRPNILMIVLESWRADTMDDEVSPNIARFARRSSVFENHFSSGNATPTGIFSLFYGIHPTYWTAVKANSSSIHNPVLIDALEANGYAFGIFADSHFQRHKIKDAIFTGIEVHEVFAGRTPDVKDRDLTEQTIAFAEASQRAGRPFFGFAFYKSTHFSYYYPKDSARFLPATKLNIATATPRARNRQEFFNDYRNSVHYTDGLVGDLLARLEAAGILQNTIVVITSDHGEEFDDNHSNYWGHAGNFTGYQTRVPMIVYVPWEKPRRVDAVTAHVDIPPTLLREGLGCGDDVKSYSNGVDLFGPIPKERPVVVSSYVNHAVIVGDDVLVVYPMVVQKHSLWNINERADAPRVDMAKQAVEEMSRFYRRVELAHR